MKRYKWFYVILLCYLISNGCINFKIDLPDDPGWGIEFFIISNYLDNDKNYEKVLKTEKVKSTDEFIYSIIKILNIEKKVNVSWVWYDPDNKIAKKSSATEVNSNSNFLEYFVIWDSISRSQFNEKKGKWSVSVFVNGEFFAYKKFVIH